MNHLKTVATALLAVLIAAGAVQADSDAETEQPDRSMAKQWNEAMETLDSATAEHREKALRTGRKTLDAMDERIEKLQAWTNEQWDSLSENTRKQRTEMLRSMREQRNNAAEWFGGMKHSSAETWEDAKQGFIKSYEKLQDVYGDAVDSLQSDDGESGSE